VRGIPMQTASDELVQSSQMHSRVGVPSFLEYSVPLSTGGELKGLPADFSSRGSFLPTGSQLVGHQVTPFARLQRARYPNTTPFRVMLGEPATVTGEARARFDCSWTNTGRAAAAKTWPRRLFTFGGHLPLMKGPRRSLMPAGPPSAPDGDSRNEITSSERTQKLLRIILAEAGALSCLVEPSSFIFRSTSRICSIVNLFFRDVHLGHGGLQAHDRTCCNRVDDILTSKPGTLRESPH